MRYVDSPKPPSPEVKKNGETKQPKPPSPEIKKDDKEGFLDGKPEADYRQGCYAQLGAAFREQSAWPKSYQNDYFELRLFRNGNGHLCFKRLELIDAMNTIIARHFPNALAAPR